ncbi:peptidylprolyl isomerase [Beijerinckia indica]|uniref:Parvulin-like PPIase n=1 Tax=Beijerinckia indica subsp. indica (strain ATCC 9039 / DSM 1715 / NCIMB 8712) TaxID=395963 RepID=B2IKP9_BEII9|nr:peptidylprolyl isomerase [Beijerinckia indica]ACB95088.1 PpiC-type peptidyl-prolyl cis-trans isomerase [Beijerinckia indica subsp. indica ATCC 9039]
MLEAMRVATRGWIGRSLMTLVMGLIILSFIIWGVGDMFRNLGANTLAKVGDTEITTQAYREAYSTILQRLQRQARRAITHEEARMLGLDRQILARLIGEATLNQEADKLGLALADSEIARIIAKDELFKGANGAFDRQRFEALLRDNGMTEKTFVREQHELLLRHMITDAVVTGLSVPKIMLEMIHAFQTEARDVDTFLLPASSVGEIAAPTEDELSKYFADRAQAYATQERRKLLILSLDPTTLAATQTIAPEDVQKLYDSVKAERFSVPEKRQIEQISFPDLATAGKARQRLDQGENFEALLADQHISAKDADLGTLARSDLIDQKIAEAAFALPEGAVSQPIQDAFGAKLLRIVKIIPASVQPFASVEAGLKQELATAKARQEITGLHDKIEDLRASGKNLSEVAQSLGLKTQLIESVDAHGQNAQGAPIADLPNGPALLKAAFASDVGVDNDTLTTPQGGFVWFEVQGVDKARRRTLEEARSEVEAAWRQDETNRKLALAAAELIEQIDGGKSIADVARDHGNLEVRHVEGVTRADVQPTGNTPGKGLPPNVVTQIFNVGVHGVGSAADASGRLIFQVQDAKVPPFDPAAPALTAIAKEADGGIKEDVLAQYVAKLQKDFGTKVNLQALGSITNSL